MEYIIALLEAFIETAGEWFIDWLDYKCPFPLKTENRLLRIVLKCLWWIVLLAVAGIIIFLVYVLIAKLIIRIFK